MLMRNVYLMITITSLLATGPVSGHQLSSNNDIAVMYQRPNNNIYVNGSCDVKLSPNKAVITGGISSQGTSIQEASYALEETLKVLRKLVKNHKGQYVPLERIHAFEDKQKHQQLEESVFYLLQRLELEFPVTVDIDSVLVQIIDAGMNKFGSNINLYNKQQKQIITRYRFSEKQVQPQAIQSQCIEQALDQWCQYEGVPQGHLWCEAKDRAKYFQVQNINLKSQSVLQEHGNSRQLSLHFSRGSHNVPELELMGNLELRLRGNVQLRAWPK